MTTATTELDQRRADVACLELIDAAFLAHAAGDTTEYRRRATRAAGAAPDTYLSIHGAMAIGEVPNPALDPAGWVGYLAGQREALTRLEAEAT